MALVSGPGRGKTDTWKLIRKLQARDGDNCTFCGEPVDFLLPFGLGKGASVDHIRPRAAGGGNEIGNLQIMHFRPCQITKGSWWEGVNYARENERLQKERELRRYAQAAGAEWERMERAARRASRRRNRPQHGYVPGRD